MNTLKPLVRQRFSRSANRYEAHDLAQRTIAGALWEVLESAGVPPALARVLDAGCGPGRDLPQLRARFPHAQLLACDFAPALLAVARQALSSPLPPLACRPGSGSGGVAYPGPANVADPGRGAHGVSGVPSTALVAADLEALPFAAARFDLYWSNCVWQWTRPEAVVGEAARVLRPGGWLATSIILPESLPEIAAAFAAMGRPDPRAPLPGAERWQQALTACGWEGMVFQRRSWTFHFPDARALLASIRGVGANTSGLTPQSWNRRGWQALWAALERQQGQEGLPLSYEVLLVTGRTPGRR